MAKHEYEIRIRYTETYTVFVEADDYEAAEEKAMRLFDDGKVALDSADTSTELIWSDEENEVELPDEED